VVLGLGGILIMTVLVQYGVTHMPVHRSAVLALIELVAGAVSQQLLTDEVVSAREWAGGALILAGAWLSARATVSDEVARPRRR
jgi:drug/metabolite transporter (DMT)-like permease